MTEINPAAFLQNAGTIHTAEVTRTAFSGLVAGSTGAGSLKASGGVHPALGSLSVFQNGTPNMSVNIGSGVAFIPGSEGSKQGLYGVLNDATVNKAIAASDPSLPRIDLAVAKVQDAFYSGAVNSWSLAIVTGTPAGSPAVPTAPANSLILGQIAVGAGVTTIVNANITDKRTWLAAVGGVIRCTSTTRPTWPSTTIGLEQLIKETDTGKILTWSGTAWVQIHPTDTAKVLTPAIKTSDTSRNTTTTLTDDPHLTLTLESPATYYIRFDALYNSPVTPSFKTDFTSPSGTTCALNGTGVGGNFVTTNLASALQWGGSTVELRATLWGRVVTTNPGALTLRWAQFTSSGSATILRAGSVLTAIRVT